MTCATCDPSADDLWSCHEIAVRHADGSVECLADDPCDLPFDLHHWQLTCDELDPPCRCGRPVQLAGPSHPSHPSSAGRHRSSRPDEPVSPAAA